jgi:Ca-activated chloride channel homolog
MALESGERGVGLSKALNEYKKAERDTVAGEQVRSAAGRTFTRQGDFWVDTGVKPGLREEKVKYLSTDYFDWVKRHPELKAAFALGDRVRIVVGSTLLLIQP